LLSGPDSGMQLLSRTFQSSFINQGVSGLSTVKSQWNTFTQHEPVCAYKSRDLPEWIISAKLLKCLFILLFCVYDFDVEVVELC
jgi:hypothetical protein